uniref:Flavin reductase like domain-containing protein n=1 Tax=termite gut metagenome TaxID=433724 RepID=S0DEL4_9ZZZZ
MMKKLVVILSLLAFTACCNAGGEKVAVAEVEAGAKAGVEYGALDREGLPAKSFDEIFAPIDISEVPENMFKLIGGDLYVITAGNTEDHNSMVAGWGGWGILLNKPVTWCFLHASRYTLDYMKREKKYTICFFDEAQKDEFMPFGAKSGRDSDKMKEHTLLPVVAPGGSVAYKEAKLVIECTLAEVTTVSPDDFYTPEGQEFGSAGFGQGFDYRLVFGDVTGVWIRK